MTEKHIDPDKEVEMRQTELTAEERQEICLALLSRIGEARNQIKLFDGTQQFVPAAQGLIDEANRRIAVLDGAFTKLAHQRDPATLLMDATFKALDLPRIITSHDYPPIPDRSMDWSAVREGYDGADDSHCPIGRGRTEQEAIADLIEKESE
jgi:hypothetical protein